MIQLVSRSIGMLVLYVALLACRADADSSYFRVEPITDSIIAYVTPDPTLDIVDGNSYAIITSDGVFVIDAHQFPNVAEANIADIRTRTSEPIRYLLNTHWHGDHNSANFIYRDSCPGIQIIAQAATREILSRKQPEWIEKFRNGEFETYVPFYDTIARTGKGADGKPVAPFYQKRCQRMLDLIHRVDKDARRSQVALPNVTFENAMTLYLGGTEIQIKHPGRGNTPGDAFVWLPKQQIVFTGDLLVSPIPYCFGSFHEEWLVVLDTIIALKPKIILPGHGEPMHDLSYLTLFRDALGDLVKQIHSAAPSGKSSLDTVYAHIDMSAYRSKFTHDDPELDFVYKHFFVRPTIDRELKILRGEVTTIDEEN